MTGRKLTSASFVSEKQAEECDIVDRCPVRTVGWNQLG